jgi:hypothetical protein
VSSHGHYQSKGLSIRLNASSHPLIDNGMRIVQLAAQGETQLLVLSAACRLIGHYVLQDESSPTIGIWGKRVLGAGESTTSKGISIRGLEKLAGKIRKECANGRFSHDKDFSHDGKFCKGTTSYSLVTTTQVVYLYVKDKAVTGSKRLADCPDLIDREHIGPPTLFVSHAWDARWSAVVSCVVDFANEKGMDKDSTYVWLDVVAVNQHREIGGEALAQNRADVASFKDVLSLCTSGTLVVVDNDSIRVVNPANRIWCLYEVNHIVDLYLMSHPLLFHDTIQWDWTITLRGTTDKIFFRGIFNYSEFYSSIEIKSAKGNPDDIKMIHAGIVEKHGTLRAFEKNIKRELLSTINSMTMSTPFATMSAPSTANSLQMGAGSKCDKLTKIQIVPSVAVSSPQASFKSPLSSVKSPLGTTKPSNSQSSAAVALSVLSARPSSSTNLPNQPNPSSGLG